MAISARLRSLLDQARVKYAVAKHPVVYTAQEIAAAQHVPGRRLAKSVLINTDRGPVLAVLSAIYRIDLKKLKAAAKAKTISIAKEADIKNRFPDVEVGAMSPFGHLYQTPVIVDYCLETDEEIVFNAGSHAETIKLRYRDFTALEKPKTAEFCALVPGQKRKAAKKKKASAKSKKKTAKTGKKKPSGKKKKR